MQIRLSGHVFARILRIMNLSKSSAGEFSDFRLRPVLFD